MKRISNLVSMIMVLLVALMIGVTTSNAATALPDAVTSDAVNSQGQLREVEFIENYPVIYKSADNGRYNIYCMNINRTFASNVTFYKTGVADPGFAYIMNNRPNTGNKDRDFYITQMAVWYYEDYLNQDNGNLPIPVKKYLIAHKDSATDVSKEIIALLQGAKDYKKYGYTFINSTEVKFTVKDGEYVSSEIRIVDKSINKKLKYSLTNAPIGSKVIQSENGVIVTVPENQVPEGKQVTIKLNVSGQAYKSEAYYYHNSDKYQDVIFQDTLDTVADITDSIEMTAKKKPTSYDVKISKTDITQSKEVAGATLVVKNENNEIVSSWVSTTVSHNLTLKPGKYSLTETIAPAGYKLSKVTIYFQVDENGKTSVKNNKDVYENVDRVVMINELIDVVTIAKKDKDTDKYVSGAKLVIKDASGKVVREFTSTDTVYQLGMLEGEYTLSEIEAPNGYVKSNEVVAFKLLSDGTLKVKNNKGEYLDSAMVIFYNSKEKSQVVTVPATGKDSYVALISGIALLIGGAYLASKTIKGC